MLNSICSTASFIHSFIHSHAAHDCLHAITGSVWIQAVRLTEWKVFPTLPCLRRCASAHAGHSAPTQCVVVRLLTQVTVHLHSALLCVCSRRSQCTMPIHTPTRRLLKLILILDFPTAWVNDSSFPKVTWVPKSLHGNCGIPESQTVCPCIFQICWSCRSGVFWHFRKPLNTNVTQCHCGSLCLASPHFQTTCSL